MKRLQSHIVCGILLLSLFLPLSASAAATYEAAEAAVIPWSGYWWPFTNGGLATGLDYRGHPAPLEKYELLTAGWYPGSLAAWYRTEYYDPAAPSWWGLCLYWAWASCTEPGPILPSSEDNIIFRVGDKKGLLTLAHDSDVAERDNGSRPEIFHFWLLNYIKDQKVPFVADLDPSEEVWSFPIYRYQMQSTENGNRESVQVTITYSSDFVTPDFRGVSPATRTYRYDLFLNEGGEITGGEWVGEESIANHPDRLSFSLITETDCPYIDYEEVRRLARSMDDFLESGEEPVDIGPGTYNLVLLDVDRYRIPCQPGDTLSFKVKREPGSNEKMTAVLYDGTGTEAARETLGPLAPLSGRIIVDNPPYMLEITQADYADPNIYAITVDLTRSCSLTVPFVPNESMWSGFSLTNPGDAEARNVTLTTYTADGMPVQSLLGPLTLAPREKRVFLFESLPWRAHERAVSQTLEVNADEQVMLINLFGPANEVSAACLAPEEDGLFRFVLPDTEAPLSTETVTFGGVENRSFEPADVLFRVYSRSGELKKELLETIGPRASLTIHPGSPPFSPLPAGGWIEVIGGLDENLTGYQYVSSPGKAHSLFGLNGEYNEKLVPHVPPPGKWITTLTVINPTDMPNQVTCHLRSAGIDASNDLVMVLGPREKRTFEIQDQFGKQPGESDFHSMLEVTGEQPLAGYFTYSSSADTAAFPLLDASRFSRTLILPHYPPPAGKWWTGIGLCNPTPAPITVQAKPYDKSGTLMEEVAGSFAIEPGMYHVFTVQSFFGQQAAKKVSFIIFEVDDPEGMIGGFYLYGNEGNLMLTGAVM